MAEVKKHIVSIPYENFVVLKFMINFLKTLVEHKDQTKMDSSNLAMCLGPDFVRPKEETMETTLSMPKANFVIQVLIDNFDHIFKGSK